MGPLTICFCPCHEGQAVDGYCDTPLDCSACCLDYEDQQREETHDRDHRDETNPVQDVAQRPTD